MGHFDVASAVSKRTVTVNYFVHGNYGKNCLRRRDVFDLLTDTPDLFLVI